MKIIVAHNQVSNQDAPDARDVLVQAEAVSVALVGLGHSVSRLACDLNLDALREKLATERPDLVFNLVEDLGGQGRLIHFFPFLLDSMGIAYTGAPAEAIFLSSHKTLAKERMIQAGLATPAWVGPCPVIGLGQGRGGKSSKWIIKSLWEHASLGLDAASVLETRDHDLLLAEMEKRQANLGGICFAEEFIDGREFNLSLLASAAGVDVLPPAEIVFADYSPYMVQIVDYQAKWQEDSFAYNHTVRRYDFNGEDQGLLQKLKQTARRCWDIFGLAGYARVDFRVNPAGRPFILEVNANPCISPDAGFAAALGRARIGFEEAVGRIIADSGAGRN